MLKGTTKIELTDVNTGEKQVYEKHNTITGALRELFNPVLGHLTSASNLNSSLPAYTTFLGGLLLFNSRIEGEPLPLFAPGDAKLVGCARYNTASTTVSKYMGSYDASESELLPAEKKAKLVYNFTQSQANGTINSVCLTHSVGGLGVYNGDVGVKLSSTKLGQSSLYVAPLTKLMRDARDRTSALYTDNTEYLYAVDVDNDFAYYFKVTSTKLTLVKRRACLKHYSMFGNTQDIVDTKEFTLPTDTRIYNLNGSYNYDIESGTLNIMSSASSIADVNKDFWITIVPLNGASITQKVINNTYGKSLGLNNCFVYSGRVYMTTSRDVYTSATINGTSARKYDVVSFNLDDGTYANHGYVVSPSISSSSDLPKPMCAMSGRLYWQALNSNTQGIGGLQVTNCVDAPNAENTSLCGVDHIEYWTYSSTNNSASCVPVINHPMLLYLSYSGSVGSSNSFAERFYYLAHYLGTINNLATPIVKAPTQTMKITYTIQET